MTYVFYLKMALLSFFSLLFLIFGLDETDSNAKLYLIGAFSLLLWIIYYISSIILEKLVDIQIKMNRLKF